MIFIERSIILEPDKQLIIVPFSDIQSEEEYPRLKQLIDWLVRKKALGHKVLMFGGGDYFESPAPSDRAALRAAKRGFGHYEELAKDIMEIYIKKAGTLAENLEPVREDILGFLRGHHWCDLDSRIVGRDIPPDTNRLLAELLETEYLGSSAYMTININGLPFYIYAAHGYGSARTPGARVAKRIRMGEVQLVAHWYAMAHDNEKVVYPRQALIGREYHKQYHTGMGSFQRSYKFDVADGTYAEDLLLPPSVLGVVMCTIQVQEDEKGNSRLDYHIST